MTQKIIPCKSIKGDFTVPPDKSMSHRAVLFGSLTGGLCEVQNFLFSEDCLASVRCARSLGIRVEMSDDGGIKVYGKGLDGLSEPDDVIDSANSGTTARILSGILSSRNFFSVITGDESLKKRPMKRIIEPLRLMGAQIWGRGGDRFLPLAINGRNLNPLTYKLPVASAQVKSCIIAAALNTDGETIVTEPFVSRDHTERMLKSLGAGIECECSGKSVRIIGGRSLKPFKTRIPGDISSAAFLISAALIVPGSKIVIREVGMNPTRIGFLQVIERMGASVSVQNRQVNSLGEPYGDIHVESSDLHGIKIEKNEIPSLIDELPLIAILGAKAKGKTIVAGAEELRVKESDRIISVVENLNSMGVEIDERDDGFEIEGVQDFKGAEINPHGDHRIAMAFAVAGLASDREIFIQDSEIVSISYPGFWDKDFFRET